MKLLKISFIFLLLCFCRFVFALDNPQNIVLNSSTDNSLNISWDKIEGAGVYAVSYGKESGSGGVYEHELELLTDEKASVIIKKLEPKTKYYIAIKAYDSDNNESEYSDEVSFSTKTKLGQLKISNLELVDTRNLNLKFNLNLNNDSLISLNLINLEGNLENIEVEKYEIKNNFLKIFLNNDLKLENKYSLTVVTLEGINGETIKAGVDGIKEFFVNKDTKKYLEDILEDDLSSADVENEELEEINSKIKEEKIVKMNKVLGGTNLENSKKVKVTENIAKNKEDLPTTGPAETFLFLIFSFIAGGLFINLRRKMNT